MSSDNFFGSVTVLSGFGSLGTNSATGIDLARAAR